MDGCDVNRFTSIIILLLVLAFLSSPLLVSIACAAEDSWVTLAPIPTKRFFFGVAVVDGKIYAIGGAGGVNATEMYDPVTNTWHTKASMPTPRSGFGIAVVENKIYVIGGSTGDSTYTNVNEVYDPATDTWETKTSMPTTRHAMDANVVDGKIYVIGGNSIVNEVYDPATDSWTTKTPIPTGVGYYASAVVDNKIYVIGGAVEVILNQIYDTETDTWSSGAPLPKGVDSAAAVATTGVYAPKRIYVIGGKQNLDAANLTQIYDTETDTWSTGTAMPTSRYGLAVAVVNDVVYAIGGIEGWIVYPVSAANEQYTPAGYIPEFPSWTPTLLVLVVFAVAVVIYKRKLPRKLN
jgi:N-acetylneuraminic acid mutarotase